MDGKPNMISRDEAHSSRHTSTSSPYTSSQMNRPRHRLFDSYTGGRSNLDRDSICFAPEYNEDHRSRESTDNKMGSRCCLCCCSRFSDLAESWRRYLKRYDKKCNRNICQDSFVKKCYAEHFLTKLRFACISTWVGLGAVRLAAGGGATWSRPPCCAA
jgi:hypothetical protein